MTEKMEFEWIQHKGHMVLRVNGGQYDIAARNQELFSVNAEFFTDKWTQGIRWDVEMDPRYMCDNDRAIVTEFVKAGIL